MERAEVIALTEQIKTDFLNSRHVLKVMGHETRQSIMLALMTADQNGLRVGELMKKTHLSRPTLYEHLKILLDSELVTVRHEGTKNYYMGCCSSAWDDLKRLLRHMDELEVMRPPEPE